RFAGFRSRQMITSPNAVIYTYVLWLIGKRDFSLSLYELRSLMARWFFMAHTTGRYTSSTESANEADLSRISQLQSQDSIAFVDEIDRLIASNFTRSEERRVGTQC